MSTNMHTAQHPTLREKKVVPQALSHVVLRTSPASLTSMRAWYLSLLDASVAFENDQICFIGYDEEHHRIGLLATAPSPAEGESATQPPSTIAHIAFTLTSLRDLADFYRTRKARGIKPSSCINHGPTMSMYYDDPDGNGIEVMVWIIEGRDSIDAYLATPDFQKNPIGADFDPDEFLSRIENGESEELIKIRPDVGPRGIPV